MQLTKESSHSSGGVVSPLGVCRSPTDEYIAGAKRKSRFSGNFLFIKPLHYFLRGEFEKEKII